MGEANEQSPQTYRRVWRRCARSAALVICSQQQGKVWRVGLAPFASPLNYFPGDTPENYRTLDANIAQGAMIDFYKGIAKDAGFQFQFLGSENRRFLVWCCPAFPIPPWL